MVARAIKNSSAEGASASYARVYTADAALLAYAPRTPSLMHPSLGYTFTWSGYQGSNAGQRVSRFRMDHLRSDRIEMEMAYDQKLVSASLGFFFTDTDS